MAEKLKKRNWTMLLYPEDPTHVAAMEMLEKGGYKYVAIKHDQDTWSEGESDSHEAGELKKEHWHVVLKFSQARYNTSLAKELGIKENYLEACANFDAACLYLVHANAEEKHQYDPTALLGNVVNLRFPFQSVKKRSVNLVIMPIDKFESTPKSR